VPHSPPLPCAPCRTLDGFLLHYLDPAAPLSVSVSAAHGLVTLAASQSALWAAAALPPAAAAGMSTTGPLTFSGTVATVNSALKAVKYARWAAPGARHSPPALITDPDQLELRLRYLIMEVEERSSSPASSRLKYYRPPWLLPAGTAPPLPCCCLSAVSLLLVCLSPPSSPFYNGNDTLAVSVTNSAGAGDFALIPVYVRAQNNPPFATAPSTVTVNVTGSGVVPAAGSMGLPNGLNTGVRIPGVGVGDPDDADIRSEGPSARRHPCCA
jgi:hypothetical protein